jgi:mono/diheme cytochrome c family protein/plastocyanin
MSDLPDGGAEERLPATRPDRTPAPAERFTAPPSAHQLALTPERAAGIVRQSASARLVGLLAVLVVVVFVIVYYFYELGVPGVANSSRLGQQTEAQAVTAVEQGYNLFEANCARCHGKNGEGGIGPILNDQAKLYVHLSETYLRNVLTVGGRYVCGSANSLMPIWSNLNGGPLNYRQIDELIAFLRAPNTVAFEVRDPSTNEPVLVDGKVQTLKGWRDASYKPAANATPVPDCWNPVVQPVVNGGGGGGGSSTPAPSVAPGTTTLKLTASGIAFVEKTLEAPADKPFAIEFDNQDSGVPHNVAIKDASGTEVFKGDIFSGVDKRTYSVPALKAGAYTFACSVHANMTGTLTVR